MGRTRKKPAAALAAEDTSFNPAEFDPAMQHQAAAIVQNVAAATHLPADMERQAAHENGHASEYTPPMTASGGPGTVRAKGDGTENGHAAAVGRRDPIIQSGLTFTRNDLLAGVKQGEGFRLVGGRKVREGVIAFAEKPSPEVIATMKDAGFEWKPADKLWTHPIRTDSAWQDRAHAEQTFEAVSKQVRAERGIEHSVGVTA